MNKTAIASAIALSVGAGSASALSVSITSMDFGPTNYAASGTLTDSGTSGNFGIMNSVDTFFYAHWYAIATAFFNTYSTTLSWTGTSAQGAYNYTFHLTGHQVAWGTKFCWSCAVEIPVLVIMDCVAPGTGACPGIGTPMQTGPFPMSAPAFNGAVSTGSIPFSGGAIPVPAAAWLFGAGLVGLAASHAVARRTRFALHGARRASV